MFSNASEAMAWQDRNCFQCWKYNPEVEIERSRCKTEVEIALGYIGVTRRTINYSDKFSNRVEKITGIRDCPYRQEKRPVYKKHDSAMPLFEERV
jgi:hypothetical protein